MTDLHRERFKGFLEQKVRAGPETVHIDVTNVCNLDCVTCWNYAPTLDAPKPVAWKRQRIEPEVKHTRPTWRFPPSSLGRSLPHEGRPRIGDRESFSAQRARSGGERQGRLLNAIGWACV